MNQQESYNLAVGLMKDELFEEAVLLLEQLVDEYPFFDQAKWALGIALVLSGFPTKALQAWKGITEISDEKMGNASREVTEMLPHYYKIYQTYNQALEHIKNSEFHIAASLFEKILNSRWEVPLPVECYQGYILTKIIVGDEKIAFDEMINFPAYIRKSLVIQELGEELHQFLAEYRNSKAIFTDKRRKSANLESVKSWLHILLKVIRNA